MFFEKFRQGQECGYSRGIVVSSRLFPGYVIVCAHDEPWRSFRPIRCKDVFVFITFDAVFLLSRAVTMLEKLTFNETSSLIQGVDVFVISGRIERGQSFNRGVQLFLIN